MASLSFGKWITLLKIIYALTTPLRCSKHPGKGKKFSGNPDPFTPKQTDPFSQATRIPLFYITSVRFKFFVVNGYCFSFFELNTCIIDISLTVLKFLGLETS